MYFEDGHIEEFVDNWNEEIKHQPQRWKGRTEFQLDCKPLPWEEEDKSKDSRSHQKSRCQ